MAATRKNAAAVALGRKGGKKGGPARAAKLTPEQRRESARKAVQARWAKAKEPNNYVVRKKADMSIKTLDKIDSNITDAVHAPAVVDTSDRALLELLKRLKKANNPTEVRQISSQLEKVIFHKQVRNA